MPKARHIRVYNTQLQQYHQEAMWENMKEIVNRDILGMVLSFDGDIDKKCAYLKNLEGEFVHKAKSNKIPLSRINSSKSFHSIKQISRKSNLSPSAIKLTLIQLRTCADRKTKNPRFL